MPEPPLDSAPSRTLEMAHVLFMDIVAYRTVSHHLDVRKTGKRVRNLFGDYAKLQ
jgi:hypothetical protein